MLRVCCFSKNIMLGKGCFVPKKLSDQFEAFIHTNCFFLHEEREKYQVFHCKVLAGLEL